jgi:GNAT superfamily N-acetyltransferase
MSEGRLRIESVARTDIDALQPLWLQLHAHHQSVAPELRPFVDPLTSWSARRSLYIRSMETGGVVLVARFGERDVGYLVTSRERSPWSATLVSSAMVTELVTIHVDPEWRGQGIGSRLLQAFEAELQLAGTPDCFLGAIPGNTRAIELYQRRGFRPTSFLLMRFGRELPPRADGSLGVTVEAISTAEVAGLRDVWVASHRRCQQAAPGELVPDDVSWELMSKVVLEAAAAGLLFRAGTRDRPVGFAHAAMTNAAVLWDTWVTRPNVAEVTLVVSIPDERQPSDGVTLALLQLVEKTLTCLDVTDHIVTVMAWDTGTIQVCRDRGFLPGWLQLSRFGYPDAGV